jgi:hypothetical protein
MSPPSGIQIGGTSASAPIWAGYISILNAGLQYSGVGAGVGFFNPTWYGLFSARFGNPLDVVDGTNGNAQIYGTAGYPAGPGYDNCTGLGSLWGGGFAYILLTTGSQQGTPPGPINDLSSETTESSVRFFWKHTSGATAYVINVILYLNDNPTIGQQTYITKGETLEVKGLTPKTIYGANVATVNASGSAVRGLLFETK